jgi:hypothetical protein
MLRLNRRAWRRGACWFLCALAPAAALAQSPAPPPPPQTDVHALVDQLGDADFKAREAASDKLKELGQAALPALKEAIASAADPEVCSRADALVRQIERPRVPADWLGGDGPGGRNFGGTQVTTSVFNGQSRTTIEDGSGQRKVVIVEGPAGIDLTVTGVQDGKPVAARFEARSPDELRDQDPDAYRVYRRWAGNGGAAPFMRGRRLIIPQRAPFRILPPPEPALQPPADDLTNLETRVQRQLNQAAVPKEKQQPVRDLLRQLQQLQAEGQAIAAEDWNKQIEKYNLLSDTLRDKLRDLKLPDPGDALPPPAKSRLGVSVGAADPGAAGPGADAGLTIHRVVPDSRAERLGLKEGDVIRTVNGKAVADTGALRRAVAEAKDPLVIEVTRAGKPETVREKPAN